MERIANNLDDYRDDNGALVGVGLGCYRQYYVCSNGDVLCATCAQESIDQANKQGFLNGDEPEACQSTSDTDARVVCENCYTVLSDGAVIEIDDVDLSLLQGYHGGQTSAIYSFCSTGGEIHGEHRTGLVFEVEKAIETAVAHHPEDVDSLRHILRQIEIGIDAHGG